MRDHAQTGGVPEVIVLSLLSVRGSLSSGQRCFRDFQTAIVQGGTTQPRSSSCPPLWCYVNRRCGLLGTQSLLLPICWLWFQQLYQSHFCGTSRGPGVKQEPSSLWESGSAITVHPLPPLAAPRHVLQWLPPPRGWHWVLLRLELNILTPLFHTMGDTVMGIHHQTQRNIDTGMLRVSPQLQKHPKPSIQKKAAWVLSNVATGPHK